MTQTALTFTGRCHLEHGGVGHWNVDVLFTLKTNKGRDKWWYEADCAPGIPQPRTALTMARADAMSRLDNWQETVALVEEFGRQAHLVRRRACPYAARPYAVRP